MAKQSYPVPTSNPNAQMSIVFFQIWVVNLIVVLIANSIMPEQIVLGTISVSQKAALVLSSGILAWFATIAMPLFTEIEVRKRMVLSPQHWMQGYFVLNAIAVWVVTRFADVIGLGVASWIHVVGLAIVLDIVQGITMMAYGEHQKSKS